MLDTISYLTLFLWAVIAWGLVLSCGFFIFLYAYFSKKIMRFITWILIKNNQTFFEPSILWAKIQKKIADGCSSGCFNTDKDIQRIQLQKYRLAIFEIQKANRIKLGIKTIFSWVSTLLCTGVSIFIVLVVLKLMNLNEKVMDITFSLIVFISGSIILKIISYRYETDFHFFNPLFAIGDVIKVGNVHGQVVGIGKSNAYIYSVEELEGTKKVSKYVACVNFSIFALTPPEKKI